MQAKEEAQAGKSQADAAKADNLALLERLKYVQGYQTQPRTRKSKYTVLSPHVDHALGGSCVTNIAVQPCIEAHMIFTHAMQTCTTRR